MRKTVSSTGHAGSIQSNTWAIGRKGDFEKYLSSITSVICKIVRKKSVITSKYSIRYFFPNVSAKLPFYDWLRFSGRAYPRPN